MDEDLEIVQRFKKGEKEAFSLLVHKYKKPVLNIIYRFIGSSDEAEDLAQDVFLKAYKGLLGFKKESKFFTWLYRITVNTALKARKRRSKFFFQSIEEKEEEGKSEIKIALSDEDSPEARYEKQELLKRVRQAIDSLPEDQKTAIILYRYENLSYDEISKVMGISVSAVKSKIHRARRKLKEYLAQYVMV